MSTRHQTVKTYILAVEVFPSPTRPHYLKAPRIKAGVYVRVGSTNRQADPAAVAELQRTVRGRSFDEEPLPELNSEAIDFRVASECFAPVRRLSRADLRSMHLITTHQRREVPTVGGVLLFGVDRLKQFPDAFLRAGCFQGTWRSYSVADGLPGANITAIVLDQRGELWLGTDGGGLIRFDGARFFTYRLEEILGANVVGHVAEDLDGRLWFSSKESPPGGRPDLD